MNPSRTLLTFAFAACMIVAMPTPAQVIVAHRGASADAPENTLAAFRLAWEQGADGSEGDFHLSKDGQIVCIHDATTKRTADRDLEVKSATLEQLRALDVGAWKSPKFAGERIATLADVLATVPAGKLFYVEVKCGPEILPELERVLAAATNVKAEQLRIISFNAKVIAEAKQRIPHVRAHWITGFKKDEKTGAVSPTREKILKTLADTKADGLNAQGDLTQWTPAFVAELKAKGLETAAWTVDKPEVAKALADLGVWGITTNKPAVIRKALGK